MTGDELKTTLRNRGCTQAAFAEHVGKDLRTVQRWCNAGAKAVPTWVPKIVALLPKRPPMACRAA